MRVRLIGIDTPEMRDPLECFGPEATDALESLAPVGSEVGYAYDRDPQDRFERELMYLYAADGTLINLELVAQGYAEAIRIQPNDRFWHELQAAERAARDADRGLWGSCPAP
nr:thermonuclease family protein [Microcella alkalica]